MIMAADKQRSALMNMLAETTMMTGMVMFVVSIGDGCSGVVVASKIQATSVNT